MTTITDAGTAGADLDAEVERAARCLYDAEVALHIAHQTHVDEWIAAAAERLHAAIIRHSDAVRDAYAG